MKNITVTTAFPRRNLHQKSALPISHPQTNLIYANQKKSQSRSISPIQLHQTSNVQNMINYIQAYQKQINQIQTTHNSKQLEMNTPKNNNLYQINSDSDHRKVNISPIKHFAFKIKKQNVEQKDSDVTITTEDSKQGKCHMKVYNGKQVDELIQKCKLVNKQFLIYSNSLDFDEEEEKQQKQKCAKDAKNQNDQQVLNIGQNHVKSSKTIIKCMQAVKRLEQINHNEQKSELSKYFPLSARGHMQTQSKNQTPPSKFAQFDHPPKFGQFERQIRTENIIKSEKDNFSSSEKQMNEGLRCQESVSLLFDSQFYNKNKMTLLNDELYLEQLKQEKKNNIEENEIQIEEQSKINEAKRLEIEQQIMAQILKEAPEDNENDKSSDSSDS